MAKPIQYCKVKKKKKKKERKKTNGDRFLYSRKMYLVHHGPPFSFYEKVPLTLNAFDG